MPPLNRDNYHFTDHCLAFQIEAQDIKGRIIRLDNPLNELLAKQDCPDNVKALLGQAMVLTALLGSMMKYEGILTLQIKSDGRVKSLVSDFSTDGNAAGVVRGYAQLTENTSTDRPVLGNGQLMITIDQGQYMDRYQGVVKLLDNSLKKSAEEYFHSSEQLPTSVMISCDQDAEGRWTAGALMIQHLARNTEDDLANIITDNKQQDDWTTATILLSSLKNSELLDSKLSLQDILLRLYHESGVRLFTARQILSGCRCSDEKLRNVLASFDTQELRHMAKEGLITITCEFCKTDHRFELKKLIN